MLDFSLLLLMWQTAGDGVRLPNLDQATTAAVIFLLIKEILDFLGKFMPGLVGRGGAGQGSEYLQEVLANRTAAAIRAEVAPVVSSLNALVARAGNMQSTRSKIDRIADDVAQLVRSDDDHKEELRLERLTRKDNENL